MATVAPRRWLSDLRLPVRGRPAAVLALVLLAGVSLYLRTRALASPFWIDEGLSVGIGSHAFADIPGVLRQDGSPPLYYMLLHVWMELFGDGEAATQVLSLVFGIAAVPVAFWLGRSLFGTRSGWFCAVLAALNPYLTAHAQETRMYSLVVLLSMLAAGALLKAFVERDRRWLAPLALVIALLLYTHNWSLFLVVGVCVAIAYLVWDAGESERRGLIRDAALALGGALLLYSPWLPTLAYQAAHTGAPWANVPAFGGIWRELAATLGGPGPSIALLAAWTSSQFEPAWANRYFAVMVGPVLLLAGAAVARAGNLGIAALVITALFWAQPHSWSAGVLQPERDVMEAVSAEPAPLVRDGDFLISTHPERTAVLHYYLPEDLRDELRWVTALGPVDDPRVMDWRDALTRLQDARTKKTLDPVLATVPVGGRVLLVRPIIRSDSGWDAPWTRLVRRRSAQWTRQLTQDERFVRIAAEPESYRDKSRGVRALVYEKATR